MTSRFVSHARRRPLGGLVVFTVLGLWTAPIDAGPLALLGLGLAGVAVMRRRSARARVLAGNVEAATPRRTNGVRSDQSAER